MTRWLPVALLVWCPATVAADTFDARFQPPAGFHRLPYADDSFAAWLRRLPLKPPLSPVRLFNGSLKQNQAAHLAVLDISVGTRDLQQCADAVMRLRAEYLRSVDRADDICFHLTSGAPFAWSTWKKRGPQAFTEYLNRLFAYAGTASLARFDLGVPKPAQPEPGDVVIVGGYPGHAVMIVDVVEDERGRRKVALVQSYMPAQDIHVLDNPSRPGQPWYEWKGTEPLQTPEWTFPAGSLRRCNPIAQCR